MIKRLKNQLKLAYKENRELFSQRQNRNPPGVKFVNETLKLNKEIHRNKSRNEKQNSILKKALEDVHKYKFIDNCEKIVFMEGANWMGNIYLDKYNFSKIF